MFLQVLYTYVKMDSLVLFVLFALTNAISNSLGENNKPAGLIYNGMSYSEVTTNYKGKTYRFWKETHPGSSSSTMDIIFPQVPLEKKGSLAEEPVNDEYCLFGGDYLSINSCNRLCRLIQHSKMRKGECINNVCFCLWDISGSSYSYVYATLRASAWTAEPSVETLTVASRKDDLSKAPRFKAWPKDFKKFSLTEVESPERVTLPTQLPTMRPLQWVPESPSESPERVALPTMRPLQWVPESPSDSSPDEQECHLPIATVTAVDPSQRAVQACSIANALDDCEEPREEIECYDGDELITKDECHERCQKAGDSSGVRVQQGFCEGNTCYCVHYKDGSCKKSKLSAFEKQISKKSRLELDMPVRDYIRFHAGFSDSFCP